MRWPREKCAYTSWCVETIDPSLSTNWQALFLDTAKEVGRGCHDYGQHNSHSARWQGSIQQGARLRGALGGCTASMPWTEARGHCIRKAIHSNWPMVTVVNCNKVTIGDLHRHPLQRSTIEMALALIMLHADNQQTKLLHDTRARDFRAPDSSILKVAIDSHPLFLARCCLGKVPGGAPFSQLHKGDGKIARTGHIMQIYKKNIQTN